jgi:O-antigen/teichoic acid export membrane protein
MSDAQPETIQPAAGHAVSEAEDDQRLEPAEPSLRHLAARGTIVNAGFQIGLSALGTVKRVAVAAFLTRAEYGTWAIILPALLTLIWIKDVGVGDKYIQQEEPDQEAAFQKAFTMELFLSLGFFALCAFVIPLYGLAYGHSSIVLPGMVLAASVPLSAFESPAWIPYRRMQYARQRALTAVDPVIGLLLTIALAAAGFGYWSLVIGVIAGSVAGAVVCVVTCPYRLRLRFDRGTVRSYASFSLPLLGSGLSRMVVVQGSLLTANRAVGLAGLGAIGLATSIATFSDRVDGIVSSTIYPAVCRVANRVDALAEAFVKSNRIALMWAIPVAVAVALFDRDLVHFVLGDRWQPAVGLLTAFALTCGIGQLAFNWAIFMRAVNRTRPIFIAALLDLGVFFVVSLPAMLEFGLAGYAAGFAATTLVQICLRAHYMSRLLPGFNLLRQLTRSVAPAIPPLLLVLLARWAVPGDRTLARAVSELALYVGVTVAVTFVLERRLVTELLGYLRRPTSAAARPAASPSG